MPKLNKLVAVVGDKLTMLKVKAKQWNAMEAGCVTYLRNPFQARLLTNAIDSSI
jgi:hypothetical protein